MSGEKILVIEDEENILEAIKYSLTREGYEVYGAIDGEKGLVLAQQLLPPVRVHDEARRDQRGASRGHRV